jgi:hypothetical protein
MYIYGSQESEREETKEENGREEKKDSKEKNGRVVKELDMDEVLVNRMTRRCIRFSDISDEEEKLGSVFPQMTTRMRTRTILKSHRRLPPLCIQFNIKLLYLWRILVCSSSRSQRTGERASGFHPTALDREERPEGRQAEDHPGILF